MADVIRRHSGQSHSHVGEFIVPSANIEATLAGDRQTRIAFKLAADAIERSTIDSRVTDPYLVHMRKQVDKMLDKHESLFKGMVRQLSATSGEDCDYGQSLLAVADQMFNDGQRNWGRIVALYAFSTQLGRKLVQDDVQAAQASRLVQALAEYVASQLGPWIAAQGGWDDFLKHFPQESDWESRLLKGGILATGVSLGLLAGLLLRH